MPRATAVTLSERARPTTSLQRMSLISNGAAPNAVEVAAPTKPPP